MLQELPTRQHDVLNAIVELTDQNGYPPTLQELATSLGLKNRMTVHQHVVALKKKGLVHWEPKLNRSMRVVDDGLKHITVENKAKYATDNHNVSESSSSHAQSDLPPLGVPLAGRIAAGMPIDAIETPEYLRVESEYAGTGCYALEVRGDSMIDDGIYNGDYVIVKPSPSPLNGEIVVALLEDGSATLKRFYKENGRYRLQPGNSQMEPIFIDRSQDLQIQGVVVGLFRRM
ncbi:MAG: transcriptional repressor LexA [Candidatus Melainabacteria bacterium]|nr:transcriptional repressor LexA [Candidatus Melainabacteria bacterium]